MEHIDKINTPITLTAFVIICLFGYIFKKTGVPIWCVHLTFASAIVVLVWSIILSYMHEQKENKTNTTVMSNAEFKCKSLIGSYRLQSEYVYKEIQNEMKGTAKSANWIADSCTKNEDGSYNLIGKDKTEHSLEVLINNVYQKVAIIISPYQSTIKIGNDGTLLKRTIDNLSALPTRQRVGRKFDRATEKMIDEKIQKYIDAIVEKHDTVSICSPLSYEDNHDNRVYIIAVCSDYTRTLFKKINQ